MKTELTCIDIGRFVTKPIFTDITMSQPYRAGQAVLPKFVPMVFTTPNRIDNQHNTFPDEKRSRAAYNAFSYRVAWYSNENSFGPDFHSSSFPSPNPIVLARE